MPDWPAFSTTDDPALWTLFASSNVQNIAVAPTPAPPAWLFGEEPPHSWCYYFERASLAAQHGDWAASGDACRTRPRRLACIPTTRSNGCRSCRPRPSLAISRAVKDIATRINTEKLYRQQACANLECHARTGLSRCLPEMQAYIDDLFCGGNPRHVMSLITATSLSKSFGAEDIFRDVSLSVAQRRAPGPRRSQRHRQDHPAAHPGRAGGALLRAR